MNVNDQKKKSINQSKKKKEKKPSLPFFLSRLCVLFWFFSSLGKMWGIYVTAFLFFFHSDDDKALPENGRIVVLFICYCLLSE